MYSLLAIIFILSSTNISIVSNGMYVCCGYMNNYDEGVIIMGLSICKEAPSDNGRLYSSATIKYNAQYHTGQCDVYFNNIK